MTSPKHSQFLQRRVATAPTQLQPSSRPPAHSTREEADTIFNHVNAKVVSLVAVSKQTFNHSSRSQDSVGPWQSHFERIIAIGAIRLYRAPGSVVFLSCGSALQPIFPKSQCWCMEDDGSQFILQIRPPSYWRIELAAPYLSDDGSSSTLRSCLSSVLLLDKTPCPFKESVPISLRPEPLSIGKRQPGKPLRSYPSEPILAGEAEEVFDADVQNLRNNVWIEELPIEHQVERKPAPLVTLNGLRETPNLQDNEDTGPRSSLEEQMASVSCNNLQDTSPVDGSSRTESAIVDNHGTNGLMYSRQLFGPSQKDEVGHPSFGHPSFEQYPNTSGLDMSQAIAIEKSSDEKRASSEWLDTETDAVIQPPTIIHQKPFTTGKPNQDLAKTKAEICATANQTITTSAMEGGLDNYAQPGDEPESRLRRKRFGARISSPDNALQSSAASPDAGTELLHTDILLTTILLLIYAICGIGVVAWQAAKRVYRRVGCGEMEPRA